MKTYLLSLCMLTLTGCASSGQMDPRLEWVLKGERYGYKDYDVCHRCGEKIDQLPNPRFDAQIRRARGEDW